MQNLFRPPSPTMAGDLARAARAVAEATPLKAAHGRELPYAVRDLSRMLTLERASLHASYWINKRLLTAYCRYFLPWNLLRLSRLLPNLGLSLQADDTVLDLGSGPLTLPLALWVAFPRWRSMPLTFVCGDIAPGPLETGRAIFRHLAGESPWRIELMRGPLHKVLRAFTGRAALVGACNVLNEIRPTRDASLADRLGEFADLAASRLAPGGRILAVEPGTRLGGKLMVLLRHASFASRLVPDAPCTHWDRCPMLEDRANGWCHFTHTADGAPDDLVRLTRAAKLAKTTLSLSCLLLRPATEGETAAASDHLPPWASPSADCDDMDDAVLGHAAREAWASAFAAVRNAASGGDAVSFARILSDPIRLPGEAEAARYGCARRGLVLVRNALRIPSGAALEIRWPERDERDPKSGAVMVGLPSDPQTAGGRSAASGGERPGGGKNGQSPAGAAPSPRRPIRRPGQAGNPREPVSPLKRRAHHPGGGKRNER